MSIWTHVNCCIRYDRIEGVMDYPPIESKIGNTYDPYSNDEVVDNRLSNFLMPFGSEGSLNFSVWKNPHKNSFPTYTVSIFGDLRDYDNVDELINYFKKITVDSGEMIRNAVMEIAVEGSDEIILLNVGYKASEREYCINKFIVKRG